MPSFAKGSEITHNNINVNLGVKKDIIKNININAKIGYYTRNHHLDYERIFENSFDLDAAKSRSFDVDINSKITFPKIEIFLGAYSRNVIEMMQIADFPNTSLSRADGEIMIPRDETISTQSLYSQITFKPSKKIRMISGIRIEHLSPYSIIYTRGIVTIDTSVNLPIENRVYLNKKVNPSDDGFAITPSFALLYSFNNNNIIKLMLGTAIKQPTFMDNLRQSILHQPFLKPQRIGTIELNYLSIVSKHININTSVFFNYLYDLITQTNEFSPETGWKFLGTNEGELRTIGAEMNLRYQVQKFCTNISLVYQKTTNEESGYEDISIGYSPQLLGNFCVKYNLQKNITLAFTGKYTGKMETEWQTSTTPEEGHRIGEAIPGYFILDTNLNFKNIINSPFSLGLKISNITGREIRYPTTKSNSWIDKGYLGTGRQIVLNISYSFN